ncbi:hypothetical protein [Entomohabitans teleogrylli]|uniref:hypothetical protein n=1 Tax=Entomohabitans teleogrylli TaxID=1384589 RepID=UPI00073D1B58|nr:hypothetical protein [Entomohabitans teleogrylli]
MKITPTVEQIADVIQQRAQRFGWKSVGVDMAAKYQEKRGGDLLPAPDTEDGIRNAVQRVRRIWQGLSGCNYRAMAEDLRDVALETIPTRQRMELEQPDAPELSMARVMEAYGQTMSAITVRCPSAMSQLNKLIESLQALYPIVEQMAVM